MESEGGKVSKDSERENFINLLIDEGELLPEAVSWKCPRSLDAEIRKGQA